MELKNKRVLVVGLGKSGMAAALFLRDQGARVTVSDSRSAAALASEIPTLLDAGIMVETGGHGLLTFRRQDLIVVSPGVPFDTPELKQVRALGRAADHRRAGAGEPVSAGQGRRDHGIEWEDDDHFPAGQDLCRCGRATLVGGNIGTPVIELIAREHAGDGERAGGFELSVGDGGGVSSADRGGAEYYARPPGPAWHVRELRGDEGADYGEIRRRRIFWC